MEKKGIFFRPQHVFIILLFVFLLIVVKADVISINSGGDKQIVINPDEYINGFFIKANTAPSVSGVTLNSSSGNNQTLDNLICSATLTDAENETMNATLRWYENNTLNLTIDYNNNYANGTFFSAALLSGNTSKENTWMCSLRTSDGIDYSEWINSSSLTIKNTPPTVELVSPEDNNQTTNRTPEFSWSGSDADNDSLTYELNLTCYNEAGGGCSDDNRLYTGLSSESFVIPVYLKYLIDNNYYYNWTVRAYDGEEYSSWATPRRINIQASVAISLINNTIDFGTLNMDESKNTTTNNPYPFSMQNDGNSLSNISVNSSALWSSVTTDSDYYKFKVDNLTGEEGSFNWNLSKTNWTQMPLGATPLNAITELNWSDSNDSAEVDLLVTVPPQEPAGDRESTVLFTASLGE